MNGVVGIKPTIALVSRRETLMPRGTPMSSPPIVGTLPPSLARSPISLAERSGWRNRANWEMSQPDKSMPSNNDVTPARIARTERYSKRRKGPQISANSLRR